MAKMTKAQKKRMIRDIQSKTRKLYAGSLSWQGSGKVDPIISTKDMEAVDKLTAKWMKRIG